ncbi:SDR family oxidoreductase [Marinobacter changyiensis]|uniref:SDR family oxidoreductase n=1 Tax=Marinobacter changyiensis TaxID=2604091 RepID=UPI00126408C2|nr:SDR family oxidoreductase [Marinobacter changyiensis]
MKLQESVIAITGGGQGLGRAMAEYFAARGAKLALIDLMPEKLDEAVTACKAAGGDARAYICNVAREPEVEETFAAINRDFGKLNGLINNAGILRDGMLVKAKDGEIVKRMSLSEWQSVIDVNLTGVFLCGREAATHMIQNGDQGAIINIASISRAGNMGQSNYSSAKAGVSTLVPVWAKELARHGIRVMGIAPGFVGTEMTQSMKPEALERMTAAIPLKRMGRPEEIASTAAFIFENDYLSGRIIEVDGALRI